MMGVVVTCIVSNYEEKKEKNIRKSNIRAILLLRDQDLPDHIYFIPLARRIT